MLTKRRAPTARGLQAYQRSAPGALCTGSNDHVQNEKPGKNEIFSPPPTDSVAYSRPPRATPPAAHCNHDCKTLHFLSLCEMAAPLREPAYSAAYSWHCTPPLVCTYWR